MAISRPVALKCTWVTSVSFSCAVTSRDNLATCPTAHGAGHDTGPRHRGEGTGAPHKGEGAGVPHKGEGTGAPHKGEGTGAPHKGERTGARRARAGDAGVGGTEGPSPHPLHPPASPLHASTVPSCPPPYPLWTPPAAAPPERPATVPRASHSREHGGMHHKGWHPTGAACMASCAEG